MSSLNLEQHEPAPAKKKNNRNLKIFLGIGALIAVPAIGTTLAASITINTAGTPVQFGQGITMTAACQSTGITLIPSAAYVNAANNATDTVSTLATSFKLSTVAIAGLTSACEGKYFTIKVYDNQSATGPLTVSTGSPATRLKVLFNAAGSTIPAGESANYTITSTSTSFTLTLLTQPSAGSVYKFTLESSDS